MTNDQHLARLHPTFADMIRGVLADCLAKDCPMRITQSLRTPEYQAALYAQGRKEMPDVNHLRKTVGLAPLTERENQRVVTHAKPGSSIHEFGLAVDLAYAIGHLYDEPGHPLGWRQVGMLGEARGCSWGGRFPDPDRPHLQWLGALTLSQLRAGMRPPVENGDDVEPA